MIANSGAMFNCSHELRTPLTLMLGPLESLILAHSDASLSPPPTAQTLARLSLILRNSSRLLKLVNSILRFSAIEAGRLETRFQRQPSFGLVTRQLIECFDSLSVQSGLELRMIEGLAFDLVMETQTNFDVHDVRFSLSSFVGSLALITDLHSSSLIA